MNKKQAEKFDKALNDKFRENMIKGISNGYKAGTMDIKDMVDQGKTLEEIKNYCDLILNDKGAIEEVAIGEEEK